MDKKITPEGPVITLSQKPRFIEESREGIEGEQYLERESPGFIIGQEVQVADISENYKEYIFLYPPGAFHMIYQICF